MKAQRKSLRCKDCLLWFRFSGTKEHKCLIGILEPRFDCKSYKPPSWRVEEFREDKKMRGES